MSSQSSKPVIGLIGGIGSGKSAVAAELVKHGGRIVSGDKLGHDALLQPDIKEAIVRRWGKEVLDENGEIARRTLGVEVFAAPAERKALEVLVFPYIERGLREEIDAARQVSAVAFVILDAAIMLETGWNKQCDWLVYVHAPRAVRLARLAERRGWSEKEVAARESAQMPLTDKVARADWAIDNSGTPAELTRQVDRLLEALGITHRQSFAKFR